MRFASALSIVPESTEAADGTNNVPVLPKRLLVVDDEDSIRTALSRFLSSRGFDVENAASGQAALRLLGRERFTVMLCDVRMPGMTGLDVLHQALADDPDLAVVMLTAVNECGHRNRGAGGRRVRLPREAGRAQSSSKVRSSARCTSAR